MPFALPASGGALSDPADSKDLEYLRVNCAALRARWGWDPCPDVTAERPSDVGNPTGHGTIPPRGAPRVQLPGGEWRLVHDEQRPLDEARAWLSRTLGEGEGVLPPVICIIGAGAGWIVDAIEARSSETRMLVLEPEPAFIRVMLARRDFRSLVERGRLMIVAGPSFEGRSAAWRLFGRAVTEPTLMIHPVIAVARREAAVAAARLARQAAADARSNDIARRRFAAPYLVNTLRNLPVIARESDAASLFGLCPGRPIVVAGAGPSLNRNLDALRPLRDRVVLVAADTALRPCLAAGLAPDFVVGVDPGAPNARHLTRLPPCETTALVAEPSLGGAAFEAFEHRTFLYRVAEHHPWPWVRSHGVDVTTLRAWGSVQITAFDLAVKLGGDPVIFIGTDLAYTDGQPYCRGTVYEEDWTQRAGMGESLEAIWRGAMAMHPAVTEHHDGESIATAPHLVQFRDAILEACRSAPCAVFNATGRGILHGTGIAPAALDTILHGAASFSMPVLPRRQQPAAAVDRLAAALEAHEGPRSVAGLEPAWADVLAEHDPRDSRLADDLVSALSRAAIRARSPVVVAS
jgi:hypothetical protein